MKTLTYPRFPRLVVTDAEGDARSLNQEVWRHEKEARSRALPLVIEIYAPSVLASRRLTEWWQSGDQLMQDTLNGVYLLRVNLNAFGPEAVLRLTPYAVAGAPLFVGWNDVGQVCSRTQFHELTREAFAPPLSAFIEDVLLGRPHTLNPVPSLGNAERTREAQAIRTASAALYVNRKSTGAVAPGPAPQVVSVPEVPSVAGSLDEASGDDASEAYARPPQSDETHPAVGVIELDVLLTNARNRFGALEDRVCASLKFTLDDLRAVDEHLAPLGLIEREAFAREFGAVLAVYLGDTIRQRVQADWVLADTEVSAKALELRASVVGEEKRVAPIEWVVEILSDSTRSLYGQALSWCRIL